ncbi:sugar ABC transporter substrate-binding protein [Paenibacillus sp. IB182496]|uniref:Sugar ABC transporter substrate-binding protein n=1 Tax=Paenibacillus sabuli TaxID=2772509 RepID=A0A927GTR8_9BACL|nr:sugar ABC transporter substrate-binding protein [Paenibacillus sabuli]MBD2848144.1 sugar ABC transporter substrate-binding protein [Paenibacillus sabuli]
MKKTGWLGMVVAFGTLLSACSGENEAPQRGADNVGDPSSGQEEVTLTFWSRWPESQPVFEQAIQEFEDLHPNIHISFPSIASSQYSAQLQAAVASNDLPDIFSNHASIPTDQLVQLGLIRDLNDLFPPEKKAAFYEGTWTEGFTTMDGNVYALPHFTPRRFANVMFYNLDVLEQAGLTEADVPASWSELEEVGGKIRRATEGVYPLILGIKTDWLMNGLIGQMGSAINPDVLPNDTAYSGFNYQTGTYEQDSAGIVQTMEFIKQLQEEKLLHPNSLVIDYREASALFAGGQAAFVIDGTFLTSELQKNNQFDRFGVAPLPTKDGKPQYYAFQGETKAAVHVSKQTKHYEEVKLFLSFYMDRIYALQMEEGIEGSPIIAQNEALPSDNAQFKQAQTIQDETFILSPHQYSRNLATIQVHTELNGKKPKENYGKILEGYLAGQIPNVETALGQLAADYNAALEASIAKVAAGGTSVSLDDYTFPNWVPFEPYTQDQYDELDD